MFDRTAPAWDVRHRIAVGVGGALVAIAALLAGIVQQVWERDPEFYDAIWYGSWVGAVGLTLIAGVFIAFIALAAGSFLLRDRRAATILVLLIAVAATWFYLAVAGRLLGVLLRGTDYLY